MCSNFRGILSTKEPARVSLTVRVGKEQLSSLGGCGVSLQCGCEGNVYTPALHQPFVLGRKQNQDSLSRKAGRLFPEGGLGCGHSFLNRWPHRPSSWKLW